MSSGQVGWQSDSQPEISAFSSCCRRFFSPLPAKKRMAGAWLSFQWRFGGEQKSHATALKRYSKAIKTIISKALKKPIFNLWNALPASQSACRDCHTRQCGGWPTLHSACVTTYLQKLPHTPLRRVAYPPLHERHRDCHLRQRVAYPPLRRRHSWSAETVTHGTATVGVHSSLQASMHLEARRINLGQD